MFYLLVGLLAMSSVGQSSAEVKLSKDAKNVVYYVAEFGTGALHGYCNVALSDKYAKLPSSSSSSASAYPVSTSSSSSIPVALPAQNQVNVYANSSAAATAPQGSQVFFATVREIGSKPIQSLKDNPAFLINNTGSGVLRVIALPVDFQGDPYGIFLHGLGQYVVETYNNDQPGIKLPINAHTVVGGLLILRKCLNS